jgi:hypothetical protein
MSNVPDSWQLVPTIGTRVKDSFMSSHLGTDEYFVVSNIRVNEPDKIEVSGENTRWVGLNHLVDPLEVYSRELDLSFPFTVESLIEAHRRLRTENAKTWDERRAEMQQARDWAAADTRKYCLANEFISVERLKSMTLAELTGLISNA